MLNMNQQQQTNNEISYKRPSDGIEIEIVVDKNDDPNIGSQNTLQNNDEVHKIEINNGNLIQKNDSQEQLQRSKPHTTFSHPPTRKFIIILVILVSSLFFVLNLIGLIVGLTILNSKIENECTKYRTEFIDSANKINYQMRIQNETLSNLADNLSILQEKGIQGSKGEIGPQGPKGEKGEIGPAGPQGVKGKDGSVGDILPIGAIMFFSSNNNKSEMIFADGSKWVECDGRLLLRSEYTELFEIIGENYGKGDGIYTFNIPNIAGRTILGAGKGNLLTERKVGEIGGAEYHVLTINQMPAHFHMQGSEGLHNHYGGGEYVGTRTMPGGGIADYQRQDTSTTGGNEAHNNMMPFIVILTRIRIK